MKGLIWSILCMNWDELFCRWDERGHLMLNHICPLLNSKYRISQAIIVWIVKKQRNPIVKKKKKEWQNTCAFNLFY